LRHLTLRCQAITFSFPYNEAFHRLDKEKLLDPEDKEQDMANSTPTLATTSVARFEVEFVIS